MVVLQDLNRDLAGSFEIEDVIGKGGEVVAPKPRGIKVVKTGILGDLGDGNLDGMEETVGGFRSGFGFIVLEGFGKVRLKSGVKKDGLHRCASRVPIAF